MATLDKQYRIIGAKATQFSLNNDYPFQNGAFDFDLKLAVRIANPDDQVGTRFITTVIDVGVREKDKTAILATIQVQTIFEALDFDALFTRSEVAPGDLIMNQRFYESISKISISITRGILLEKLSGTPLNDAVLPLSPIEY